MSRKIFFTNTATHKKEEFQPIDLSRVTFYSCGPTVYDLIHIGNLRAALTSDLIYRTLKTFGYSVFYVRNYTDVDDRIIARANKEGIAWDALTNKTIAEVEKDYALAQLLEPTQKTRVTDYISEIIQMIEDILKHNCAYVVDGEVFFAIDQFPRYGKLSGRNLEDLIAGERVDVNAKKKNPLDFSLWKPAKPGEPSWASPWGLGRPGWHIECSAMAKKWLGAKIDLHHGGSDLIFPHHENEIAQTEAATGEQPFVKIWLHNAFLNINQEKMSKSLGNFITARDFLREYGSEVTRLMIFSAHYRSILDFDDEHVESALGQLERIYEAKKKALEISQAKALFSDPRSEEAWGGFHQDIDRARNLFLDHMANDLNSPAALSEIFVLVREWNRMTTAYSVTAAAIQGAAELIKLLEGPLFDFLGLGRYEPQTMLDKIAEIRRARAERAGKTSLKPAEIEELILARKMAREAKDFAKGDAIRKQLLEAGIEILDGPKGTTWKVK